MTGWCSPARYHGWGFHEDGAASGLRAARRLGADWPAAARRTRGRGVLTPALYRTRITHLRRAPVHHYFEHTRLQLVCRHRPICRSCPLAAAVRQVRRPRPPSTAASRDDSLRQRIDAFLAERGIDLRGGTDHRTDAGQGARATCSTR